MKRVLVISMMLLLVVSSAFAIKFQPQKMVLSAPSAVKYDFGGAMLSLPVTVSGKSALATFCVYTKDQGSTISKVKNGYLGWHYVNKIDTSVYVSTPIPLTVGSNTITWNGKDDDGKTVPAGTYTYYIWAYDNQSAKQLVESKIMNSGGSGGKIIHIQETGTDGKPLANPVFYGREVSLVFGETTISAVRPKWTIGNDPMDSLLIETTRYDLGTGFSSGLSMIPQPDNFQYFFLRVGNKDAATQGVRKLQWVPNGVSTFETKWGDNGIISWSGSDLGSIHPGPDIVGDYLWTGQNGYYVTDQAISRLYKIDWKSGELAQVIDISEWWSNVEDGQPNKGQLNGGPNGVNARNGMLYLNCHCSCIKQMVNPSAETMDDFYLWTNQNGDYILDHNYQEGSSKAWVCNDYKVGPYTYHISPDNNGFNNCPIYDMGAVSFGLLGPDGDGIGNFAFAGDTAGWKWFNHFVQNGGAFDGIYCDDNERWDGALAAKIPGLYYIAFDSIKGVLSNQVGVAEEPAVFSVAQNTPNPFNPTTTINITLAKAGKVTVDVFNVAGQKVDTIVNANLTTGSHSFVWNAAKFSAGVYFYTVKANGFEKTMKMTLLK